MAALGFPMRICQGVRTLEEQRALYAQGRTAPGPIVTHADGIFSRSNHQVQDDGKGHAVDCAFIGTDPFLEHDPLSELKWNLYGLMGKSIGLSWGGDFKTISDRPHFELAKPEVK